MKEREYMSKIINVANRLPVTIKGNNIKASSGGLVAAMEGLSGRYELEWIGWPGASFKSHLKQQQLESRLVEEHGYHPVFLNRNEICDFYNGFSNSSLWPLLHYMTNYVRYEKSWWQQYESVNQRFAEKILDVADKDDIIWVHDYHLMLVPSILRQKAPELKIGFFLHTPFPSYEIFRCHPKRTELLHGLIGANLLGFHTFGYLRHFRSAVMRILGIDTDMSCINTDEGVCQLGTYPIGINSASFRNVLASDDFREKKEYYTDHFKGKKVVLSVERLDYTKGIPRRINAIDKFLEKWPNRSNICFVFVAVPSRDEVTEYQELRDMVEYQIGRINGKYSTLDNVPVRFIHHSVDFTELCALYSLADVAMVTPLIDGMNLVAKEYAMCKSDGNGALILSEFAGSAHELFKAIKVNPYDVDMMAGAIEEALTMEQSDKTRRMTGMYERVSEYDAVFWANSFLSDLASLPQRKPVTGTLPNSKKTLKQRLKKAKKIAMFLDYDGTLREFQDSPEKAKPTVRINSLLKDIKDDRRIDGYLISGRKADNLDQWFGDSGLSLIAEHGFEMRESGQGQWRKLTESLDQSWKQQVRNVLEQYSGTVPGSFIEEKFSAIVWHYRRADPEFGEWKAKHLVNSLNEMKANLPVEVHEGAKIVEISSMQISKGGAVQKLIEGNKYDLVICAGDDYTDETMFRLEDPRVFSIKVGRSESAADTYVKDPDELMKLIKSILTET
jgi:trehalose 6-phosphate synthase/phosphatase